MRDMDLKVLNELETFFPEPETEDTRNVETMKVSDKEEVTTKRRNKK